MNSLKTALFAALLMTSVLNAQRLTAPQLYDPHEHYSRAMAVLIGWGGASMAAGIPMALNDDPWVKRIGTQNIVWGGIDAAIGVGALLLQNRNRDGETREEKIDSFRRTMVINGILDFAYVATGIALMKISDNVRLRATGAGFVIQGSFLLAFDWSNYGLTFR